MKNIGGNTYEKCDMHKLFKRKNLTKVNERLNESKLGIEDQTS